MFASVRVGPQIEYISLLQTEEAADKMIKKFRVKRGPVNTPINAPYGVFKEAGAVFDGMSVNWFIYLVITSQPQNLDR